MRRSAFTLLELLVTISVIALLIAISVPVLGHAMESARSARCRAQLKQFGPAFMRYRDENRGMLPFADSRANFATEWIAPWDELSPSIDAPLPRWIEAEQRFETGAPWVCPSDEHRGQSEGLSYQYALFPFMDIQGQAEVTRMVDRTPEPWPLMGDGERRHKGGKATNQLRSDYSVGSSDDGRGP